MSSSIGSLFIELGLNAAAFEEGISKATYKARAGAQEIGSSLRGIGGAIGEITGEFSRFGGVAGASLATVGTAIGKVVKEMGGMSGASGYLKAGAAGMIGLAAGAVTAGAAVTGIAVHAAESANKLHELSQQTGIGVHELSGLSVVGKIAGVEMESLSKGLERMSKNALVAAQAPAKAQNAFRTLGIEVLDASGHLKSASDLFLAIADKFSQMGDGSTKTALAMQIFGRAGAELIPVLNEGREAMSFWISYGQKVGAVLSDEAAEGAHVFHEQLTKLDLIQQGVQNNLMTALLPALNHVTAALTTFAEKGNAIQVFGSGVGKVIEGMAAAFLYLGYNVETTGTQFEVLHAKLEQFARSHKAISEGLLGYYPAGPDKGGMSDEQLQKFIDQRKGSLDSSYQNFRNALAQLGSNQIIPVAPEGGSRNQEISVGQPAGDFYAGARALPRFTRDKYKTQAEATKPLNAPDFAASTQLPDLTSSIEPAKDAVQAFNDLFQSGAEKDRTMLQGMIAEFQGLAALGDISQAQLAGVMQKLSTSLKNADVEIARAAGGWKGFVADLSQFDAKKSFFTTLSSGVQDLNKSLAQLVVTGKGGFIQLLQQMEMQLIELGLRFVEAAAMQKLFAALGVATQSTQLAGAEVGRQAFIGEASAQAAVSAAAAGPAAAIMAAAVTEGALQSITALATGGDIRPGGLYLTGEKGPELIMSKGFGRVMSAGETRRALDPPRGGGDAQPMNITVNHQVQTMDSDSFREYIRNPENTRHLADAVVDHIRRSNTNPFA